MLVAASSRRACVDSCELEAIGQRQKGKLIANLDAFCRWRVKQGCRKEDDGMVTRRWYRDGSKDCNATRQSTPQTADSNQVWENLVHRGQGDLVLSQPLRSYYSSLGQRYPFQTSLNLLKLVFRVRSQPIYMIRDLQRPINPRLSMRSTCLLKGLMQSEECSIFSFVRSAINSTPLGDCGKPLATALKANDDCSIMRINLCDSCVYKYWL